MASIESSFGGPDVNYPHLSLLRQGACFQNITFYAQNWVKDANIVTQKKSQQEKGHKCMRYGFFVKIQFSREFSCLKMQQSFDGLIGKVGFEFRLLSLDGRHFVIQ